MDKKNKIAKNSFYIMVIVLTGKLIGFIKQSVIAWKFGTSAGIDVYFSADSFVNMISQILIMSIPPAIVTIIIKLKKDIKEKEDFINSVFTFFLFIGFILLLLNFLISPIMSKILGISYSSEQQAILQKYLFYLSPSIIFACISGVSSGLLQSKNKFIQDKLMGIFLSLTIIICTIFLESKFRVGSLLIGFILGYFLFTLMMFILLLKNTNIRLVNPFKNYWFNKYVKLLMPIIISIAVVDISHLIDKMIASSLSSGSVSTLYYGQIICSDLVNGVVIASIGVVLLPKVTKELENRKTDEIVTDINSLLSIAIPIMLLIMSLYLVAGRELVKIAFERGAFTSNSTELVYRCAIYYSFGLPFIMIKEIISKYLFAMDDTVSPMLSNIISIILNIILSIFLSKYIGVSGIALATSISVIVSNVVLVRSMKDHFSVKHIINNECLNEIIKSSIILVPICTICFLIKMIIKQTVLSLLITSVSIIALFLLFSKLFNLKLYDEIMVIIKKIKE